MGSLVAETTKMNAMRLYPKVLGYNPSERWGHSACFSGGLMYVFGVRIVKSLYLFKINVFFVF